MKKIQIYLIIFCTQFLFLEKVNSAEIDIYKKIDLFGEVLEKINKEYVDEINQSESMDSAINGLLQSLDPYSSYMSPEIFEEMQTETSGEFGGLGIEVSMEAGVVKVITPIDDTREALEIEGFFETGIMSYMLLNMLQVFMDHLEMH